MPKRKTSRGGARAGSGPKAERPGEPRNVPKSIRVSQPVADYLSEHGTGIIEELIRGLPGFSRPPKNAKN
jgi:hypothetical protein